MFGKLIENFSSTTNKEVRAYELRVTGIILLVWGCFLYLVDATVVGKFFIKVPGFKKIFKEEKGSLDLHGAIPSIVSMLIIFIGIVLILHAHKGLKSQVNIIVCPLFYTLSFMFLVAAFQNNGTKTRLVAFGISITCLIIGLAVHLANKDNFEVEDNEEETGVTTTAN